MIEVNEARLDETNYRIEIDSKIQKRLIEILLKVYPEKKSFLQEDKVYEDTANRLLEKLRVKEIKFKEELASLLKYHWLLEGFRETRELEKESFEWFSEILRELRRKRECRENFKLTILMYRVWLLVKCNMRNKFAMIPDKEFRQWIVPFKKHFMETFKKDWELKKNPSIGWFGRYPEIRFGRWF